MVICIKVKANRDYTQEKVSVEHLFQYKRSEAEIEVKRTYLEVGVRYGHSPYKGWSSYQNTIC